MCEAEIQVSAGLVSSGLPEGGVCSMPLSQLLLAAGRPWYPSLAGNYMTAVSASVITTGSASLSLKSFSYKDISLNMQSLKMQKSVS